MDLEFDRTVSQYLVVRELRDHPGLVCEFLRGAVRRCGIFVLLQDLGPGGSVSEVVAGDALGFIIALDEFRRKSDVQFALLSLRHCLRTYTYSSVGYCYQQGVVTGHARHMSFLDAP